MYKFSCFYHKFEQFKGFWLLNRCTNMTVISNTLLETYEKYENGFKIACVKCGHGPQNHDEEFRAAARKKLKSS